MLLEIYKAVRESVTHHPTNGVVGASSHALIFLLLLPFKNINLDSVIVDLQDDSLRAEAVIKDHSYLIHIGEYLILIHGNSLLPFIMATACSAVENAVIFYLLLLLWVVISDPFFCYCFPSC